MKEFTIKQIIKASSLNLKYENFIVIRAKENYLPEAIPKTGDNYTFNLFGKHIQCRVLFTHKNEIFII